MLIDESGILPKVVGERGYWTVTKKVELQDLGFPRSQHRVPALVIPIRDVDGNVGSYQIRPDQPRTLKGKVLKYETRRGSRLLLDVPPRVRDKLGDPSVPLFITEGSKKADAAVSQGLCCIALLGVWGWRGKNSLGGKAALPDWESIALNGREVFIAFDSDVMQKLAVRSALDRLREFLVSKKAKVKLIVLSSDTRAKVGLDDFFVAGGDVSELMQLATEKLDPLPEKHDGSGPFCEKDGCIYYIEYRSEGPMHIKVANFTAKIVRELVLDDGAEEHRHYEIEAVVDGEKSRFRIPADQFESLRWLHEHLGAKAIKMPGKSELLRVGIQQLSKPERTRVFRHTGWCRVGKQMVYLHAGGAIGAGGAREDIEVDLDDRLKLAVLPNPPDAEGVCRVVQRVLDDFSALGPATLTYPLLASVFRSVLGDVDHSHFIVGKTGSFKSEIAALLQSFFGEFGSRSLPGSWSSTANALETLAFVAKDMVMVIDDFVASSQRDREDLQAKGDRLFRGAGNKSGRQRLTASLGMPATRFPRGLILATGEELPAGHSRRSRIVFHAISEGDVTSSDLSVAQRVAAEGVPAEVMASFVRWLAPRIEGIQAELRRRVQVHQDRLSGSHRRTQRSVADLLLGWELFLDFAVEARAISEERRRLEWERGLAAMVDCGDQQVELLSAVDPVDLFLRQIASAFATGGAHVADLRTGEEPQGPARYGWEFVSTGTPEERAAQNGFWQARGDRIGWTSGEELYLDLNAAMAACSRVGRASGEPLPVTPDTLRRALFERGLLLRTEQENRGGRLITRFEVRITAGGARTRVVVLDANSVLATDNGEAIDPGSIAGPPDEDQWSRSGPEAESGGPAGGPESGGCGPGGPGVGQQKAGGEERLDEIGPLGPPSSPGRPVQAGAPTLTSGEVEDPELEARQAYREGRE